MASVEPWVDAGLAIDIASGVLFILLGVAVALVRPRRALNAWFTLFAVGFGLVFIFGNLGSGRFDLLPGPARYIGYWLGYLLWAAGAALLAVAYPSPLKRQQRRLWLLPALLAAGYWLYFMALQLSRAAELLPRQIGGAPAALDWADLAASAAAFAALWFLLLLMARRSAGGSARESSAALLVTWAFLPYVGLANGIYLAQSLEAGDATRLYHVAELVLTLALAALWARNAVRRTGHLRRSAALTSAATVLLVPLGMAFAYAMNVQQANNLGLLGLSRLFGIVLLAYAILKRQLFDIDVKVKWTLKQSTVAAIFVAAFFAVSELAQVFFSDRIGTFAGIGVTAGLVFAIAPLQHLGERLSDKAMPNVHPDDPRYMLERKRETYRNAYATAWADGTMTQKDMRMLDQVRQALDLPEQEIVAIEREWSRQPAPARKPARAKRVQINS